MESAGIDRIRRLMALASGDEKHDPSAHSTLDVLWVLYDGVLRYDASTPRCEDRDRFILSKGHGPLALYAILADRGFFPAEELGRFLSWEGILGGHPDHPGARDRSLDWISGSRISDVDRSRSGPPREGQ